MNIHEYIYIYTDSYLSLSLEDGGESVGGSSTATATNAYRKYRYRKVLVPSQESLQALPLKDGDNDILFELGVCSM